MKYNYRGGGGHDTNWYIVCRESVVRRGTHTCRSMCGDMLDAAVGSFIVAAVNRKSLALTLMVRERLRADFEAADRQRMNRIENLRHKADLARSGYMEVDLSNRLAIARLEAEWAGRLKAHGETVDERQRYVKAQRSMPDAGLDKRILALRTDLGNVWNSASSASENRKRLLGLLIEDITVPRSGYRVEAGLRPRGGRTHVLPRVELPRPRATVIRRDASKEALAEPEILLEAGYDDVHAAEALNRHGHRDSRGGRFSARRIRNIHLRNAMPGGIQRQRERMRAKGYSTANKLGINAGTVRLRARQGRGIERRRLDARRRNCVMYKFTPENPSTGATDS